MKYLSIALVLCVGIAFAAPRNEPMPVKSNPGPNQNIDMEGFLKISKEAAVHRQTRRLTEEDFIKMSAEPGTIILDARSKEKFDVLHIKGAVNLTFADIDVDSLKRVLPDKDARILIYCNNNFLDVPGPDAKIDIRPFVTKSPMASLNLSTYVSLYTYGYRNIYELGPRLDPAKCKLEFESNVSR